MARTAIDLGTKAVKASASGIDTVGFGKVTILLDVTAASPTLKVEVSEDGTAYTTAPAEHVIDSHGVPATVGSQAVGQYILSYIGWMPYVKVTATNGTAYVVLSEPRDPTA